MKIALGILGMLFLVGVTIVRLDKLPVDLGTWWLAWDVLVLIAYARFMWLLWKWMTSHTSRHRSEEVSPVER